MKLILAGLTVIIMAGFAMEAMAQEPRWLITDSWEGQGAHTTGNFWANAEQWRIYYRYKGGDKPFLAGVYNEHDELVDVIAPQRRTEFGYKSFSGKGHYHISMAELDGQWQIEIRQKLSTIGEWELLQKSEQPGPVMRPLATWFGEEGTNTYEIDIPKKPWQIRYSTSNGTGRVKVKVSGADDADFIALNTQLSGAAKRTSWVHRTGKFKVQVEASAIDWRIEVLSESDE